MASKSSSNILDMVSDKLLDIPQTPRALPRVMTLPGIINGYDGDSDSMSSGCRERKIIVTNMLPLHTQRDPDTLKLTFSFDEDSLYWQLKDGFSPETEFVYVGSLKVEVDASEQEEVAQKLLDEFNCVPTFLPHDLHKKFYDGFCKQQLWPLFHYMLPICPDHADRFDRLLWQAYVSANKIFADKVMEVADPDDDYIWVHDYHLMILPTFLRKRYNRVKLGFFLHSPFPSSEIYRTLPVRDEILKGLLNCDLIGFHTFDYARHFLSCCSRMMGLDYESKRGHIGLDYFGRTVYIKILPVGIQMGRLENVLNLPITANKVKEIAQRYKGKKLIVGVDDMDIFKGISLKLLAFEYLLQNHPALRGNLVLIQIVNPARSTGKDVQEAKRETYLLVNRINEAFGSPDHQPVVLIDRPVARYEKSAYYSMADCCIVNAVRDGMNLVPYKYIVCRQNSPYFDKKETESPRTSMLVVSEFVGCSPSLSGAIRVNPWDIESVAGAISSAFTMKESEKQLRHEKHYRYVSSHDVAYWARSFMQDLERASKDHYNKRCWGIGFGLGFRVVSLSPSFRKLSPNYIVSAYKKSSRRAIFLDYDGTLVPQSSIVKAPSEELINILSTLCNDPKNTVFIVSGRGRSSLSEWLAPCERLGLAAEHGYFTRWSSKSEWESSLPATDLEWKEIAEPVMRLYTEATDGSYIEIKESGLVWHHQDADPDFGACQAKELLVHLENVLANEPAIVKRGQQIVEVKPQGVTKGLVAQKILSTMVEKGEAPDFVACIGDDRSDEDMFESIRNTVLSASVTSTPEIFACTVGRKPSKAKYYLDDTADVIKLLGGLANASDPKPGNTARFQISKLYSKFPPLQIPLPLIVTATSNFAAENLIKEDSFGKYYKGQMLQSGQLTDIVARRLDCIYGQEIFFGAISIHSSLKHKNIVSFIGFCNENGEKILIYEHPAHGRLDQHLTDATLTWFQRLQICVGVARALSHVHYDVIHCNINSSKIFLDKDWEAKLSGFELSTKYPESWKHRLIFSHHFDNSGNPVYLKNATVTPKYDVYSFGVVLFEVLCGRKATIGDNGVEEGKLDEIILEGLRKQMDKESLTIFSKTAYNCLKEYAQRPTIDQVVRDLEEALEHQRDKDLSSKPLKSKNLECFRICFSDIKLATLSFNEDNCVGEGGYGKVYKAYLEHLDIEKFSPEMEGKNKNELPKRSSKVAIKRITDIQEGKEGFLAEIKLLTSCKHQNIVSLLGFSSEDHEMILVYEFLDKGSLDDHLAKKKINLTWNQRLQICLNIAEGLKYLHTSMEGKPEIIHRDIKSGNVLLDEKWNAKISDFGLSKFHPAKQPASTIQSKGYVGTVVYLDPEYLTTGKYKKETDIYSFGVVLFEILSGTLAYDPVYLAENHRGLSLIARRRFNEGTLKELIDPTMMVEDNEQRFTLNRGPNQDSFNAFTKIAYQCLAETQAKRPTMEVIIEELRNAQNFQGETMVLYKVRRNDIVQATERIGFDVHGMVYKAELDQFESESSSSIEEKNKREEAVKKRITVAIKRISSREDELGEQGFFEELEMCISYKHPNISSLLGFCDEGREMIFVYEHACNGSTLDDYLGSNDDKTVLTWAQRLRKCMEIARGLNHLHTKMGSKQSIIHGDIRSANIFFGKNFEAKIAYFGHSNLHPANQEANTKVYLDPEYEITGTLGTKSDIYSFGVVLFEILCGKLAYDLIYNGSDQGLAPIARQCCNDGTIKEMLDPKLLVETDEDVSNANKGPNQDSLDTFLKVACQCLGETQTERPTMETVITELQIALNFQEFKSEEKSYVKAS